MAEPDMPHIHVGGRPFLWGGLWVNFIIFPSPFCIFQFFSNAHFLLMEEKQKLHYL